MLGLREHTLEKALLELHGDDGAVSPDQAVRRMRLDGEDIVRPSREDLASRADLTRTGEQHIQLKKLMNMGLYAADAAHGTAQRISAVKADDRIGLRHVQHSFRKHDTAG